jgi:hypothetical protein
VGFRSRQRGYTAGVETAQPDPVPGDDIWVTARHAADVLGCRLAWVDEQCREGRLPCRRSPGEDHDVVLVPMAATRELAAADDSTAFRHESAR